MRGGKDSRGRFRRCALSDFLLRWRLWSGRWLAPLPHLQPEKVHIILCLLIHSYTATYNVCILFNNLLYIKLVGTSAQYISFCYLSDSLPLYITHVPTITNINYRENCAQNFKHKTYGVAKALLTNASRSFQSALSISINMYQYDIFHPGDFQLLSFSLHTQYSERKKGQIRSW